MSALHFFFCFIGVSGLEDGDLKNRQNQQDFGFLFRETCHFFAKPKFGIRVYDFKNTKLGFTILNREFC